MQLAMTMDRHELGAVAGMVGAVMAVVVLDSQRDHSKLDGKGKRHTPLLTSEVAGQEYSSSGHPYREALDTLAAHYRNSYMNM